MRTFNYDAVVIGGGAAGFVSAKLANGLGLRVAMVEKARLGGDCTWFGCIPSKALLRSGQLAHRISHMEDYGLAVKGRRKIDTDMVMSHVRSVVQKVYNGHLPESFERLGIDCLFGEPSFLDNHSIEVDGMRLTAKKFIIATGSGPLVPEIEGLEEAGYLTNRTIFDIDALPGSMVVLGGGPVGVELGSAMNRLGVDVTLLATGEGILPKEDRELSERLSSHLRSEGLKILTGAKAVKASKGQGKIVLVIKDGNDREGRMRADAVLVAVGRRGNVDGLCLEKAGVEYTPSRILTNRRLQTSAANIYACGDVVGPYRFSHMAEYQAIIATTNAFLPVVWKVNYGDVIWCTFTDPELGHAGLTEEEARERHGDGIKIYRYEYSGIDRARTDVAEAGMSKLICDPRGKLVGAHILGSRAGEVIHEVQLAKSLNVSLSRIGPVIHAYPSYSDVVRQPAKLAYIDGLRNSLLARFLRKVL